MIRPAVIIDEILRAHGPWLQSLIGRQLERAWVVFYEPFDTLHNGTPVVLEIDDGNRLELWNIYLTEFGISRNEIDLAASPFSWSGRSEPSSRWIVNGCPPLAASIPARISDISLLRASGDSSCAGIRLDFANLRSLVFANIADELFVGTRMPNDLLEHVSITNPSL